MRLATPKLLAFSFALIFGFGLVHPARGQSKEALITLLDKLGQPTTSIFDGNVVSLKIEFPDPLTAETQIDFLLADVNLPVASCHIRDGGRSCESTSFSALGWYWNPDGTQAPLRKVIARINDQMADGELETGIRPRPVVMVHGFNADYHSWDNYLGPGGYLETLGLDGYAVGDGQVEGVMNTGSLSDPNARTNTLAENAEILGEYITNVLNVTGAEQVDLLVHSMGGMISRYYLDRIMKTDNVAQLIILGTPMAGSACASLPAALGLMLPATLEIQPSYMVGVFNQQIVHRRGVPFHALAGTKLQDDVESPCTPAPSDLVVTVNSVKAIPMPVQEMPLLHIELNTSRQVFDQFVTPLLKTPLGKFEVAVDPPAGSVAPIQMQFTKVYTGHLDPGQTDSVTISIDPNVTVANFSLYDTSRSLDVRVQGASGNEITLDPVKNGLIKVKDPSTLVYLGYGFKQPKPGEWVVTLVTTDETPAEGADYAIRAEFNGGATLTATTSLTTPRVDEGVTISANLSADGIPVKLKTAQTLLREPDGTQETLSMAVNENSATLEIIPKENGIYGIEVDITAEVSEGTPIDRAAFLSFEVQPAKEQIIKFRWVVGSGVALIFVVILLARRFKKRRRTQSQ